MFNLNESIRYYLYTSPTDMRKSFYTLSGIVTNLMGFDVCDGAAFIFINRSLDSMKILHMESGGLVIYYMKLEKGRFRLPYLEMEEMGSHTHSITATWPELVLMVQGISLPQCRRQSRWKPHMACETKQEKRIKKD